MRWDVALAVFLLVIGVGLFAHGDGIVPYIGGGMLGAFVALVMR